MSEILVMAGTLPEAFIETVDEARADGIDHPILQQMVEVFSERSERCARRLEAVPD